MKRKLFITAAFFLGLTIKLNAQFIPADPNAEEPSVTFEYIEHTGQLVYPDSSAISDLRYYNPNGAASLFLFDDAKISFLKVVGKDIVNHIDSVYRIDMLHTAETPVSSSPVGIDTFPGLMNFYTTGCPSGCLGLNSYQRIVYEDVYDKVDLHFYSNDVGLKSAYVYNQGADANAVQLLFRGQDSLMVAPTGELLLFIKEQAIVLEQALAYEVDNSNNITALTWLPQYNLTSDSTVNFTLGSYDTNNKLVVMVGAPSSSAAAASTGNLLWSFYYGNNEEDNAIAVAADGNGDAYVTGTTNSPYLPLQGGAQTQTYGGNDIYVVKFEMSTNKLKWLTVLGSSGTDQIATDVAWNNNFLYVSGYTNGPFGLQGSATYQQNYVGGNEAYLAQLKQVDGTIIWETFFGGQGDEESHSLAVTASGDVFLSGSTTSSNSTATCTVTGNGYLPICNSNSTSYIQSTYSGNQDGFLARFDKTGDLLWSTYYGGDAQDNVFGISWDGSAEKLYIGGQSATFTQTDQPQTSGSVALAPTNGGFPLFNPITVNAGYNYLQNVNYQGSGSGYFDGFVGKFDKNNQLLFSTFVGAAGNQAIHDVSVNGNGEFSFVGLTDVNHTVYSNTSMNQNPNNGQLKLVNSSTYFKSSISGATDAELILGTFGSGNVPTRITYYGGTDANEGIAFGINYTDKNTHHSMCYGYGYRQFIVGNTSNGQSNVADFSTLNFGGNFYQSDLATDLTLNSGAFFYDGYVAGFKQDGTREWSTFLGGGSNFSGVSLTAYQDQDFARGCTVAANKLYVVGTSTTKNFPYECPSSTAFCPTYTDKTDGFVSIFDVVNISNGQEETNRLSRIQVYPNPAKSSFIVNAQQQLSLIEVYTIEGKLLKQERPNSNFYQMTLSTISAGVYLLRISTTDATAPETLKLVVE